MLSPPAASDLLVDEAFEIAGTGNLDGARGIAGRAWRSSSSPGVRWRAAALLRDVAAVQGDRGGAARWAVAAWDQVRGTPAARDPLGASTLIEAAEAAVAAGWLGTVEALAGDSSRVGFVLDPQLSARLSWQAASVAAQCGAAPDVGRRLAGAWSPGGGPAVDHLADAAAFWVRRAGPVGCEIAARLDELGAPVEVRSEAWVEAAVTARRLPSHAARAAQVAVEGDLLGELQVLCTLGRSREAAERLSDAAQEGGEAAWRAARAAAMFDPGDDAVLLGAAAGAAGAGAVVACASATAWLLAGRGQYERAADVVSGAAAQVGESPRHRHALASVHHELAVLAGDGDAAARAGDDMVRAAVARADRYPDGWKPLRDAVALCAAAWLRAGQAGAALERIPRLEQPWQLSAWAPAAVEIAAASGNGAHQLRDRYVSLLCAAGDAVGAAALARTVEQRKRVDAATAFF